MGKILASYFTMAKDKGGLVAQVRLAMLTKMSKEKAYEAPDSQENIRLFEEALEQTGATPEQGDIVIERVSSL